jgi:hypothetical protein
MLRLFFKALIVIWPFLKSAIFKDRTVGEVIAENKHITVMLALNVVMLVSLVLTTQALAYYKDEYIKTKSTVSATTTLTACVPESIEERRQRLIELLVSGKTP